MNEKLTEEKIVYNFYYNRDISKESLECCLYFMNKIKDYDINFKYRIIPITIYHNYYNIIFDWSCLNITLEFNGTFVVLRRKQKLYKTYQIGDGKNSFLELIKDLNKIIK